MHAILDVEKAAYLGCEIGRRVCLIAEVRWMVEKDRGERGEVVFGIHLGRALQRCLRDMVVKCELKIKAINGWPR